MYKAKIRIGTVVAAKAFVNACQDVDFKVEVVSGPYIVDAKSIMGIFSLDLSEPIELQAYCKDSTAFEEKIKEFMI